MPTSYTWNLVVAPLTGSPPNPGTYVPSTPSFGGGDRRKKQFERGIKFGNVPDGRADFLVHGGPRVYHVNSLQTVQQDPGTKVNREGVYSGDVKFRFRSYRNFPVPASVSKIEFRSSDRFTNPVFSFTGRYSSGFDPDVVSFSSGSISYQGNMTIGRARYASGRMEDGLAVVAGGYFSSGTFSIALSSSQVYSGSTGLWSSLPDMPTAKSSPGGIVLSGSGDFLVVGGTTSSFWDNSEGLRAYRYVRLSGAWYATILSASVPRRDFEMVQIPDGRVFLPGGYGASFTGSEFYLTGSNTFSGTSPIPLAPLNREAYTLNLLDDGTVVMIGGRDPVDLVPQPHVLRFYPALHSWSIEPSMSYGRAGHRSIYIGGKIVTFGGYDPLATASLPFPFPGPLGGTGDVVEATDVVEMYDPDTRVVTTLMSMPSRRARFSAFGYEREEGPRVVLFGGHDRLVPVSEVHIMSVDSQQWFSATPLLTGVFDISAVQLAPEDQLDNFDIIIPGGSLSGSTNPTFSGSQLYETTG